MIDSKKCSDCHEVKPLTDFYRQSDRADNLRSDCKACHRARNRKNVQARWPDYRKKRMVARHARPDKTRARQAVANHIRLGNIVRPDECSKCQKECKPEAHHADYSKKLDIEWLCTTCHGEWHQHNTAV